jgi:hypothetical protein
MVTMEDRIQKLLNIHIFEMPCLSPNDESMLEFKMVVNKVYLLSFDGKDHKGLIICVHVMLY